MPSGARRNPSRERKYPTAFLEPDPEFTWDAARAAAMRDALTTPDLSTEPPGEATARSE